MADVPGWVGSQIQQSNMLKPIPKQPADLAQHVRDNGPTRIDPLWDGWSAANKKLFNNLPDDLEMIYDDGSSWKANSAKKGESVIIQPKKDVPVS